MRRVINLTRRVLDYLSSGWLRRIEIRYRLIIALILLSSLPLLISGYIAYVESSKTIEEKARIFSTEVVKQVSKNVQLRMAQIDAESADLILSEKVQHALSEFTGGNEIARSASGLELTQMLLDHYGSFDYINQKYFLDRNNKIIDSQVFAQLTQGVSKFVSHVPDLHGHPYWGSYDNGVGQQNLGMLRTIVSKNSNKMIGNLFMAIRPEHFSAIFDNVDLGSGADIFILDAENGKVLVWPQGKFLRTDEIAEEPALLANVAGSLQRNELNGFVTFAGKQQDQYLAAYARIPQTNWFVVNAIPRSMLTAEVQAVRNMTVLIGVLVFLASITVAYVISRSISKPLKELMDKMQETGNLARQGPDQEGKRNLAKFESRDELSKLTLSFDAMNDAVNQTIQQINEINASLEIKVEERTAALAASEHASRTLIENSPDTVARYDKTCRRIYVNPAFGNMTEGGVAALLGKTPIEAPGGDNFEIYEAKIKQVIATGENIQFELKWPVKNGKDIYSHIRLTAEYDASGNIISVLGVGRDITERKEAEQVNRVAAIAFETHEGIMITDAQANILRVNQAFQDITGYNSEEVVGKNPRILKSDRQSETFYKDMWRQLIIQGSWSGEIWDKRKNGKIYPKQLNINAVKDKSGKTTEYVAIFNDISERKAAEDEIHSLAFYDTLTKLPNRRLLMDRLHQALSASARSLQYGALLFLDLDRFKTINDTLGHDHGDLLLIEVAKRILLCLREMDTVARLGGDEFVILIEEISASAESASQKTAMIAEKIRAALAAPYQLKNHECHSSPSIGICLYCGTDELEDALLRHADMAMYQAKDTGRNAVRFFDPSMQQAVESHAALEADFRHAVPDKQLSLHYQIQMDNDNRPLGAEALLRWFHPMRGMVSPAHFIPIAEESSLILDAGNWVLQSACHQLALWGKHEQTRHLELAINVSAQQFRKSDFVNDVALAVGIHQVNPARLKLELTEGVVLIDVADVVTKMYALKALGIKLSLDDFGTGYSSLSYLKQLPLDQIKIDQSFVRDITTDLNDAVMVETIIGLAKNFRLNVIAEGVETEEQLHFLKEHGCMAYQGYLFSKPVPIEVFEALLGLGNDA